jgi:acetyl-CoA carboxylase biotin carboxyl carrier protein
MVAKFTIDGDAIRQLADILVDTKLTEIEYEDGGRRIRVCRGGGIQAVVSAGTAPAPSEISSPEPSLPQTLSPSVTADHPGTLKSPMVGTAYLCPEPGAAAFVKSGDTLVQGQTLMIIEAMKVMNPIKAPRGGKLIGILVQDSSPVEFGEPLMIIE